MAEQAQEAVHSVLGRLDGLAQNKELKKLHKANEDFFKCMPSTRMLVVGLTGVGKSSLLNKMAGFDLMRDKGDTAWCWSVEEKELLFECTTSVNFDPITSESGYANLHYPFPNNGVKKSIIVVDTPGHDDDKKEAIPHQARDLYTKLKNMGHLNAILVLLEGCDPRWRGSTQELVEKLEKMFSTVGGIWNHVIIGLSKCDEDTHWKDQLDLKINGLQNKMKNNFKSCTINVPVLPLSALKGEQLPNFVKLWDFVNDDNRAPLSSHDLQKFLTDMEIAEQRWEELTKVSEERDFAQRMLKAKDNGVVGRNLMLLCILVFMFRPSLVNVSGPVDELLMFLGYFYIYGVQGTTDFLMLFWNDYIHPLVNRSCGKFLQDNGIEFEGCRFFKGKDLTEIEKKKKGTEEKGAKGKGTGN